MRPVLAGFAVIALTLAPVAPLGAQTIDAYELGMAVGVALVDAEETARHLDVSVPIPRLRLGAVVMDQLLLETELAARYRTRLERDGFGSFELLQSLVWHTGGPTDRGLYVAAGAGLALTAYEDFRANRAVARQLVVGARAGYKWAPAGAVVVRTGVFTRHYVESDDRPWRRSMGAEVAVAIVLR